MEIISTSTVCVWKKDNCRNRSPGEFGEQKWVHRTKRVKIMEVEQRYVINFFSDEGMPGVQIVERLRQHYGEDALCRTQVYFWINEVERGTTDLNPVASPGREPDESLTAVIAGKLDADPHFSARKLAQSLGIAVSTICRYPTEVLGMKFRHLHWVPHTLTPVQKLMRAELAQSMLQALAKHEHTNHHFPFTGDESWMFYAYDHSTRWVAYWDDIDEIERPSHFHQKTMFTVFFNGTGEYKIAILPKGQKENSAYFIESVLHPLAKIRYPQVRRTRERRVMLHSDKAPVHNTEGVRENLASFGFRRMAHPPYSPDLAPCNFFLLSAMEQAFPGQYFATIDDLLMSVEVFLRGLSADSLQTVFHEWIQ
jgi:histone-lysine N-methyltransferase SETMAR